MDSLLIAALVLVLTNISFAWLAHREHVRAEAAQAELLRKETLSRAAGYDTGLVETPIVQVLH